MSRYPVILSTKEEDFRKIGLLPPLNESDDPTKPRDIPSPDPDTLAGLDDSEGDKSAHTAGAKQPKPKMGPTPDDSAVMDPDEDGGSAGAQKSKGGSSKVQGSKEASVRAESKQYMPAKDVGLKGKGKNKGQPAVIAKGLKPVKKIAGMGEGRYSKAQALIEDVQDILYSVQVDEESSELMRCFRLVAEDAAMLSDRLTEVSDRYRVEKLISQMEGLSADAVEALDIIENDLDMVGDEDEDSVRHSSDVSEEADLDEKDDKDSDRDADKTYDIPSPAFKEQREQSERILNVMVSRLMEGVETYDAICEDMGMGPSPTPEMEAADDSEVHLHTKAKRVHVHHGDDDDKSAAGADDTDPDDGSGDDGYGDDDQDQDDQHMSHPDDGGDDQDQDDQDSDMDAHGHDPDQDGDDDQDDGSGDSDHDANSLMTRMKALRGRREAMGGGGKRAPFPGASGARR